jgi:negative regulator of sigma-B (phosphoserine phosphatase)
MTCGGTAGKVLDWAVAARPFPGEVVSGDLHVVASFERGALIAVIDGLGHGRDAEVSARRAHDLLKEAPEQAVETLVARCHESLSRLRGAVMSVASFDAAGGTMTWVGVGNVESLLLRSAPGPGRPPRERLRLWGGVVGHNLPRLRPATLPINPGDTVVLATDGLRSSFVDDLRAAQAESEIVASVLAAHATGTDDALVLAARYRGGGP